MITFEEQRVWMARILFLFAGWTLLIKFVLPMVWAFRAGEPLHTHIWWDAWWVAHLLVGYGLLFRMAGLWRWAMLLAVVETAIIATKFVLFLPEPTWDVAHTNWFVNKSFMLTYFIYSLWWLTRARVKEALS